MTMIGHDKKRCFVCGKKHTYQVILSTNSFGSPDLDLRPPEMERSTMPFWIQCCPRCGYCAPDIGKGLPIAAQLIKSDLYVKQQRDTIYPELANRFLCRALIAAATEDYHAAGWAAVRAAWACDDADQQVAAVCRRKAIALFTRVRADGNVRIDSTGTDEALLADLLRRSGQFEAVDAICREGLAKGLDGVIGKVLRFQQTLARNRDTACYTIATATGDT